MTLTPVNSEIVIVVDFLINFFHPSNRIVFILRMSLFIKNVVF